MAAYITKQQLADRIVAAKLALDALNAKNKSLKLFKASTAMKIPKILDFQKIEGTLKADGLYGVNTKAAITWYLQTYPQPQTIPAVNASWTKQALTWKAPALEPAPKPAAKPTVTTSTTTKPVSKPTVSTTTATTKIPTTKPASKPVGSLTDIVAKSLSDAKKDVTTTITAKLPSVPESLNTDKAPVVTEKTVVVTTKDDSVEIGKEKEKKREKKKKKSSKQTVSVTSQETSKKDNTMAYVAAGFLATVALIYLAA